MNNQKRPAPRIAGQLSDKITESPKRPAPRMSGLLGESPSLLEELDFIEACIDLETPQYIDKNGRATDKPFLMRAGETLDVAFKYNVGFPYAYAFGVFFFETFIDSYKLRNPVILRQPSTVISPQIPQFDPTGILEQYGTLTLMIPSDAPEFEHYWGAIIIYQQGGKVRSVSL